MSAHWRHHSPTAITSVVLALGMAVSCSSSAEPVTFPTASGSSVVIGGQPSTAPSPQFYRDLAPYAGLGAWIDVFDFAPNYAGGAPAIGPADLTEMSRRGVKTVFLQATRWDDRSPDGIVDAELIGAFLAKAHELGMRAVGWYLPELTDVERDVTRTMQIVDFRAGEHRFDGLAVDIEYTRGEPDPAKRNEALVVYSRRLRNAVDDLPVAGVVLTAVHLEVVNPRFWPDFPYAKLADLYDVWMPMAYWSGRTGKYKNGYSYAKESVDRLRNNLGKPDAPVAPVGGISDEISMEEISDFARALAEMGAIGGSFYDWSTMSPQKQALVQRLFGDGAASRLSPPPSVGTHPRFSEADLTTTTLATTSTAPEPTTPTTEPTATTSSTGAPTDGTQPAPPVG